MSPTKSKRSGPSMPRLLLSETGATFRLVWAAARQRAFLSAAFFLLLLPLIAWRRARLVRQGEDAAKAIPTNPFVYAMQ